VFNNNFVSIKVDMEKGEGPELARKYQVRAYPTTFILNSKGEVQKRIVGYRGPEEMLKELDELLK
jgi:thioredoxin-related protein